jgi:hypothetical protein
MSNEKAINDFLRVIAACVSPDGGASELEFSRAELFNKMREPVPEFKAGELVEWKCDQLRVSKLPRSNGTMVVVAPRLDVPRHDSERGSGSMFWAMPLDLLVSALDDSGDYIEFYVDARRVTLAP